MTRESLLSKVPLFRRFLFLGRSLIRPRPLSWLLFVCATVNRSSVAVVLAILKCCLRIKCLVLEGNSVAKKARTSWFLERALRGGHTFGIDGL